MKGIVGGGNFIVDYVKTVDVFPAEQTLANIRREFTNTGGAPYNVLRNLAVLGADYPMVCIGRIGDDAAGRYILEDCAQFGIDMSCVQVMPDLPTSYTLVMVVESTGKRTFFHQRGANALHVPDDYNFTGFSGYHFHYGYLLLLDAMDEPDDECGTRAARVLKMAKEAGLTTSIDLVSEASDRFRNALRPCLQHADIVFMNEYESSQASGVNLVSDGLVQTDRIAEMMSELRPQGMVALHWAEGAAACLPSGEVIVQPSVAMPQERIASVVGAGDAFASGFLLGYLRGESLQECLRLGVCCGASCVTGLGCTDGVMTENECNALAERYGYRS